MEEPGEGAADQVQCDCGYSCRGGTIADRVRDALRHAWDVHGIHVSSDQVLANGKARAAHEAPTPHDHDEV